MGVPPLNRYGHTATSIGPHILIFGRTFNWGRRRGIRVVLGGWEFSRATNEAVVMRDMSVSLGNKAKNK